MPKISKSHSTPYFEKKFKKLSKDVQKIVVRKIFLFENNPFHPGLNTHKLKGELAGYWSFYVTREKYRVLFITVLTPMIFTDNYIAIKQKAGIARFLLSLPKILSTLLTVCWSVLNR